MMIKKIMLFFLLSITGLAGFSQNKMASSSLPPGWAKNAVWYQVFLERFNNGDINNDPKPENILVPSQAEVPVGWDITPWTSDWYSLQPYEKKIDKGFNAVNQYRRYGGDLQGLLNKLDYLKTLGINALFLNPINDAPSLHKYDARNYHHIDVNFGPDPVGDNRLIASETPGNASTWVWTAADKLFLKVVEQAHLRGIKIIMDYSWNHTGILFWAFQDVVRNQQHSPYKDWYNVRKWADSGENNRSFEYDGWVGLKSLPELKKVSISSQRVPGQPYEGDINAGAKQHIFDVSKRWLAPNGNTSLGVDGYRLDVADQIGMVFWRDYRAFVQSVKSDAYLIGEIWWKKWPEELMDPAPYTQGDVFDAVMFYQVYKPARYFFAKNNNSIDARQFKDSLNFQWSRLKQDNLYAMMNVSSSHDAPRLLTDFNNANKYKVSSSPSDDPAYLTGKPDAETYKRLRLYLVHLFTTIGAPQIYNGEEMGMWGSDDPHCRKPLMWPELNFQDETRTNFQPGKKTYDKVGFNQAHFDWYRKLIAIRKANPALQEGKLEFTVADSKKLGYRRFDQTSELVVLFNLEASPQSFKLPTGNAYKDLLTGKIYHANNIIINPLTAVILKKF